MSDVCCETTTDKLTKLCNITNQSKLSLKKKMNRLLSPVKLRGEAFYFMNQLGKKLRHIHRSPIKFTSFKKSNCDTSIVNNKISSSSSDDTIDKSEILKTINLIPMSPIKRRKEITNPNLNYEQSEFLNLCTYIKSDNYLNYDDYKSHQKNSSMTPILKRAPKMISDENDEEAKSCSKLSIKKRNKLTKEISSSESQEKTSNKNFKKIRRSVVNIKIQNKLLSNSPSKNDSSPKKKKKVKKGKKRGNLNLPESNNNTSQNIHKDILSGLNSILEEMEVEGHETPCNQKSLLSSSCSQNFAEGGYIVHSPETQSGKKARRCSFKKKRKTICNNNPHTYESFNKNKVKDMFNLEKIIEGLSKVIEEDEKVNQSIQYEHKPKMEQIKSKFMRKSDSFHNRCMESFKKFMK